MRSHVGDTLILMRRYTGVITPGMQRMTSKMSEDGITHALLNEITGVELVGGTVNVKLDREITFPKYAGRVERRDFTKHFGDTIYIASARLDHLDGWVIRHLLVDAYDGPGNLRDIVEFVADVRVLDTLNLGDGDQVSLEF